MTTAPHALDRFPALANSLRALKHGVEDMLFRRRVERHLFGGHELSVHIEDRIAAEWYGADGARPSDFDRLAGRGLKQGGRVFDLGAHQGVVAMMLAREIGPQGKVIAVEANARNNDLGRRNAALNGIANIEHLHAAVTQSDGPILFSARGNGAIALSPAAYKAVSVDGLSIDSLSRRYGAPDLIYLDIEGFEGQALKGAVETLQAPTSWSIEVHGDETLGAFGGSNADIVAVFADRYDLFWSPDHMTTPFAPLASACDVPHDRFFLVALARA